MPAAPSPKKSSPRRAAREGRSGVLDLFAVVAGLVLCAGIGYVAYRTQIRGEPVDRVLPFLAAAHRPAARVVPAGTTADALHVASPGPVAKPVSPESDGKAVTPPDAAAAARPGPAAKPGPPESGDGKTAGLSDNPDNTYFGRREYRSAPVRPR